MPTMPETVSAAFAADPTVQLVLVEMGHGYAKAKYNGRCPISGMIISANSTTVRHLVFWTRGGKMFDGYVHGKTCEFLHFLGSDPAVSRWQSWTPEWMSSFDLETAAVGTMVTVAETRDYCIVTKSWKRLPGGWRAVGAHFSGAEPGNAATYSDTSPKQLAASFRRRTSGLAFRVDLP